MNIAKELKTLVERLYPQSADFTKSEFPIYVNYTDDLDILTTKRIVILQGESARAERYLGDVEYHRNLSVEIIVLSPNDDEAYGVGRKIYQYLRKIKGDYGILRIEPVSDVDFVGFNAKKLYIYSCSYAIIKEEI